jgi:hypothetical protein
MRYFTLTFILLQLFACNEKPSNWDNPELSIDDYEPNTVAIQNYSLNGIPLVTDERTLTETFGEPTRENELTNLRVSTTDSINLKSVWFQNNEISFDIVADSAVINSIDFRNSNLTLKIGTNTLRAETTFNTMKELFPKSYDWRNPGLSYMSWLINEQTDEIREFDWIHISDDKLVRDQYGIVELSFINKKLAFLTYSHRWK